MTNKNLENISKKESFKFLLKDLKWGLSISIPAAFISGLSFMHGPRESFDYSVGVAWGINALIIGGLGVYKPIKEYLKNPNEYMKREHKLEIK